MNAPFPVPSNGRKQLQNLIQVASNRKCSNENYCDFLFVTQANKVCSNKNRTIIQAEYTYKDTPLHIVILTSLSRMMF